MIAFACPYEDVQLKHGTILAKAGAMHVRYGDGPFERVISDTPRAGGKFGLGGFFLSGDTLIVRDSPPACTSALLDGNERYWRDTLSSLPYLMDLINGESTELPQTAISVKKRGRPLYSVTAPLTKSSVPIEQLAEQLRTAIEKGGRRRRRRKKILSLSQLQEQKQATLDEIVIPLAVQLSAFGTSVAFSDDTLVIAALPFAHEGDINIRKGFKQTYGHWPQGKVFIQHGAEGELQTWQQSDGCKDCSFGHHVAVSSGEIYVSDPGNFLSAFTSPLHLQRPLAACVFVTHCLLQAFISTPFVYSYKASC